MEFHDTWNAFSLFISMKFSASRASLHPPPLSRRNRSHTFSTFLYHCSTILWLFTKSSFSLILRKRDSDVSFLPSFLPSSFDRSTAENNTKMSHSFLCDCLRSLCSASLSVLVLTSLPSPLQLPDR